MKQIRQLIRQALSEVESEEVHWSVVDGGEDRLVIEASLRGTTIARATMEMLIDGYGFDLEDFEDLSPLNRSEPIMKLESILVVNAYKGQGVGKLMMEKVIEEAKKRGYDQMYLNASPMGWSGLPHNALVEFYKKFGFKVVEDQGHNSIMVALL